MTPKVFPSRIFRLLFHYPLPLGSPKELFKFILLFLFQHISSVCKLEKIYAEIIPTVLRIQPEIRLIFIG